MSSVFKLNNSTAAILNSVAFPEIISWERVWQTLLSDSYKYELSLLLWSDRMEGVFTLWCAFDFLFYFIPRLGFFPHFKKDYKTLLIHLKSTVGFFSSVMLYKVIPSNITLLWDSFLAGCMAMQLRAWQIPASNSWCYHNVLKSLYQEKVVFSNV